MLIAQKTWREVREYLEQDDRIIIPVGSTEQHGPRAVLGTDFLAPEGIAQRAGATYGVMVVPTLAYGMSLHHMAFPGTISLKPSTLLRVTSDLVGSLARHGFRRIMLLNGHGGNIASLNAGVCEIGEAYPDIFVKVRSWWELAGVKDIVDEVFGELEGWHATPGETSIVMALHPGIVSDEPVDVFETELPLSWTSAPRWAQLFPDGSVSSDVNLASGEVGERIISACVQALEDELRRW